MFDYINSSFASFSFWSTQVAHKEKFSTWPLKTKITFELASEHNPPEMTRCSVKWLLKSCRNGITQCVNTFALMYHGFNLHKMQSTEAPGSLFIRKEHLPIIPTFNFSNHPALTAAIFKSHRESDIFTIDNGPDTIFAYIADMLGIENLNPDEIIFTCSSKKTCVFKENLKNLLTPKAIEEYHAEIYESVSTTLTLWGRNYLNTNITKQTFPLVCDVMSKILMGTNDSDGKLADAMKTFFDYVEARFNRKKFDALNLLKAKSSFFEIVDTAIDLKKGVAGKLTVKCMKNREILLIIFSLCFAGIDSTTQSIIYTFYKLSQNKSLQKDLREEISFLKQQDNKTNYDCASKSSLVQKTTMEILRMFCPVIGVTRISKEILVNASCEDKETTYRFPKGEHIAPSQNLIARCPLLFAENANLFIPERHESLKSIMALPWLPFGAGENLCPGWPIYKKLVEYVLFETSQKYTLNIDIDYEIEQVGSFINKLKEDVILEIMPNDLI